MIDPFGRAKLLLSPSSGPARQEARPPDRNVAPGAAESIPPEGAEDYALNLRVLRHCGVYVLP